MSTAQFYQLESNLWQSPGRMSIDSGGWIYGPAGSYQPSESTTGVPNGTSLTTHNGNITVTTDGTVLDSLDIYGYVSIKAANVIVRKCHIRGAPGLGNGESTIGLVTCTSSTCVNALIEDCDLFPDDANASYVWDGIIGHDYTALRSKVRHTTDGFGVFPSTAGLPANVTLTGNYVDYLAWWPSNDHGAGDIQTHNDCIQWQGGSGLTATYNTLNGFRSCYDDPHGYIGEGSDQNPAPANGQNAPTNLYWPSRTVNSCIQFNTNVGAISNAYIHGNWANGGYSMFNAAVTIGAPSELSNNIIGHDTRLAGSNSYQSMAPRPSSDPNYYNTDFILGYQSFTTISGNTYDDGTPVVLR